MIIYTLMHSQFIEKFVKVIYLFCNNNVIVIRKGRRVKESSEIFIKHISLLSFIVFLKKISLFSSHLKSLFKDFINHRYCLFS